MPTCIYCGSKNILCHKRANQTIMHRCRDCKRSHTPIGVRLLRARKLYKNKNLFIKDSFFSSDGFKTIFNGILILLLAIVLFAIINIIYGNVS